MSLIESLKIDEGCRSEPYQDSVGVWTNGYGHNMEQFMPEELASIILGYDVSIAISQAKKLPYWEHLNEVRKDVIVNMIFNLGLTRYKGFKKMERALGLPDYSKAAVEMLDSLWAVQVGDRARRLAAEMRNGAIA